MAADPVLVQSDLTVDDPHVLDGVGRGTRRQRFGHRLAESSGALVDVGVLEALGLDEDVGVLVEHRLQAAVHRVVQDGTPVGLVLPGSEQRDDLGLVEQRPQSLSDR